jgi:uncharacterized protein (TIGR00251 family)
MSRHLPELHAILHPPYDVGWLEVIRVDFRVSPGAARSAVVGRHGTGWKVRVAAAAEDGRANAELLRLLAAALDVPVRSVSIGTGRGSRTKTVIVEGIELGEVERRLDAASRRPEQPGA